MPYQDQLKGLYVITDDTLTPEETLFEQVKLALQGGAKIVQLRDKHNNDETIKQKVLYLQNLCDQYGALFVLNDKIELAIKLRCSGLHIGKSDHERFEDIRKEFDGIIGVSCYGDIDLAKEFEKKGADYVAFGSFFSSPTKPDSSIVSLDTLHKAKEQLSIPVCAIGGINRKNLHEVLEQNPDMVSVISDIWSSEDILERSMLYATKF
jgi:thiamine-phosphate pyrophosphorylase